MTVEAEAGVDLADAAANEEFDPVDAVPLVQPAVGRHSHAHIHLPDHDTLARVPDHPDLDLDLFREILAVQGEKKYIMLCGLIYLVYY